MIEHVERLRAKPLHVRRNIAYAFSAGLTLLVAVGWFGALVATGAFTLTPAASQNTTTATAPGFGEAVASARSSFDDLLGAAGAATSTSTPPALTIIETASSSTLDNSQTVAQDQTVIPF